MSRKKIEVVELNKKEEKILLEEKKSPIILFFHNYKTLIFLALIVISLTIIVVGLLLNTEYFRKSEELTIKEVSIDTTLDTYTASITIDNTALTEETAKKLFDKNNAFKGKGQVLLVKTIDNSSYTIKFYSDGSAIKILKSNNKITRISPLSDGSYGIASDGTVNSKTTISDISIIKTKEYYWGKVTYYSDGSASVDNSKMDIFIRDANDINDSNNYIADNKVSYLKETKKVNNITLNYYSDGTIEIIKNNKKYLVRNKDDITITSNDVIFKNSNEGTIIETKKLADGKIIDYYSDGGAIIRDDDNTLSVRKSNSIAIKNNKIYEIVDSDYVKVSKKTDDAIYYTNGSAVVNYNGNTYYIEENSNIKYDSDNNIISIGSNKEELTKETNMYNENVKTFENTAVVTTEDYIAILPANKIIYDENGKIKDIDYIDVENNNSFKIMNNTNDKLKYRVVIEESSKTNLDVKYIRYMCSTKSKTYSPSNLNSNIWNKDNLYKELDIKGTNYILIDDIIEPYDTENIELMLWTDYDTIPNAMQNKYFYGTIKVYAWIEE